MATLITDRNFGIETSVAIKAPVQAVAIVDIDIQFGGVAPFQSSTGSYTPNPGSSSVPADRILLIAQTNPVENGIYNANTGAWIRTGDFDGNRDVVSGTLVTLSAAAGTVLYQVTSANPVIIGTSAITFAEIFTFPQVPFYQTTAAETAAGVTIVNFSYPPGDIRRYGAFSGTSPGSGGNGDCTAAIAAALAGNSVALVPPGDWRLDGEVIIGNSQTVQMMGGAVITRYSAHSAATTPMFWFQGSYGGITGPDSSAQIITQNKCPSGVVLNGCASMTSNSPQGQDMLYNALNNVLLSGAAGSTNGGYGQQSGAPDVCYLQINPQLDGHVCYFALLNNLVVQYANYGYWFKGWANGNLMTNLHAKWIGNTKRVPPTGVPPAAAAPPTVGGDAMIYVNGALELCLSGCFFHYSPGTPTLRFEDYDNRATTNGSLHVTSYIQFDDLICEQGDYTSANVGAAWTAPAVYAQAIVANAGCSGFANKIEINDNTSGGSDVSSVFLYNSQVNRISSGPAVPNLTVRETLQVGNPTGGKFVGTLTSGSPIITAVGPPGIFAQGTVASDLVLGALLTGTGIPAGAKVTAITPTANTETGTITMSANATANESPQLIGYTTAPGTLLVGTGRQMQFVTTLVPQSTATTIIPTGNLVVGSGMLVLVHISDSDTNGNASRTDLLLVNVTNSGFVASTVLAANHAYTSSGASYDPASVTYSVSTASPASAAAPALQVNIAPSSGTGATYTVTAQILTTL